MFGNRRRQGTMGMGGMSMGGMSMEQMKKDAEAKRIEYILATMEAEQQAKRLEA